MSLQRLCFLVNKKNELALERRSRRHKLYRLRQINRGRVLYKEYNRFERRHLSFPIAAKWLKMPERDFKVLLLKAELAFSEIVLKIAEHTQSHSKETRRLSRDLGFTIIYGSDNIVDSLRGRLWRQERDADLDRDQIEKEAVKYEFELIFFSGNIQEA